MGAQRIRCAKILCFGVVLSAIGLASSATGQNAGADLVPPAPSSYPLVGATSLDPASIRVGSSFSATFSGTNLTDETYFDIRFRSPNSNEDQVVLNWQQGASARHSTPSDTAPGIWTITGVRAHEDIDDHSESFASISALLRVSPFVVTELRFDPASAEPGRSFTAEILGTNLTDETYFDVRFRAPCSDQDQVVLNWQRGASAAHGAPADAAPGIWTVSGAWAHQDINDHSVDFAPLLTTLLLYREDSVPFNGRIMSIAIDPSRSATVYAATFGSGVYKTCDGGQTWIAANSSLPDADILSLALDPVNPNVVYAGTSTMGVFKSVNGAATWNAAGAGLPSAAIRALAIDPLDPAILYTATEYNGVFKSLDGAFSWNAVNSGLPPLATIQSLAINPVNSAVVYAGTDVLSPNGAQVFKSSDGGEQWEESWLPAASGIVAETIYALVVDPSNPSVIYAGTLNPERGNNSNQAGIFKSRDEGRSWTGWGPSGPGHRYILSMAIDPLNPATVYAAAQDGLFFKSTDAGLSWRATYLSRVGDIRALAIDPSNPFTIYAGSPDVGGEGLFKSTDAGATWRRVDTQ